MPTDDEFGFPSILKSPCLLNFAAVTHPCILCSFQEWFDFNVVSEDGGDEKLIAQEQENHVLETLHAVCT